MDGAVCVDREGSVTEDWEKSAVNFTAGSYAEYTFYAVEDPGVLSFEADFDGVTLEVTENAETLLRTTVSGQREIRIPKKHTGDSLVRINCVKGAFTLRRIRYSAE